MSYGKRHGKTPRRFRNAQLELDGLDLTTESDPVTDEQVTGEQVTPDKVKTIYKIRHILRDTERKQARMAKTAMLEA